MNFSELEAGDMLLARDNLSLVTAADEEVTLRLTQYLVPAVFGIIFTLGLLGNFMVIGVVRISPPANFGFTVPNSNFNVHRFTATHGFGTRPTC